AAPSHSQPTSAGAKIELRRGFEIAIMLAVLVAAIVAAVNAAFSGFVPLFSLLSTGDSRYLDFGIPSVYGAFLAYSNALACACYYIYLLTRRRMFLVLFLCVVSIHLCFVTR